MAEEKDEEDRRKVPPWVPILVSLFQFVVGPAITAVVTSCTLYYFQIKPEVAKDVHETIDKRELADTLVQRMVVREPAAAVQLDAQKVQTLATALDKRIQEQDQNQEQGECLPGDLDCQWRAARGEAPDILALDRAIKTLQAQTQIQKE